MPALPAGRWLHKVPLGREIMQQGSGLYEISTRACWQGSEAYQIHAAIRDDEYLSAADEMGDDGIPDSLAKPCRDLPVPGL
jgi:hypothetical protein